MTRGGNDTRPLPRDYIARRAREGALDIDIARELMANADAVGRVRRRLGIPRNYRPTPSPELLAQAAALLDDGASRSDVAETLGIHKETLAAHLPGRAWTRLQIGQHSRTLQRFGDLAA